MAATAAQNLRAGQLGDIARRVAGNWTPRPGSAWYCATLAMREASFGRSAVIPEKGNGGNYRPFYTALGTVYDTDTERQQQYGRANYKSRVMLYRKDCDTVMPLVVEFKLQFALVGLNAEIAAPTKVVRAAHRRTLHRRNWSPPLFSLRLACCLLLLTHHIWDRVSSPVSEFTVPGRS